MCQALTRSHHRSRTFLRKIPVILGVPVVYFCLAGASFGLASDRDLHFDSEDEANVREYGESGSHSRTHREPLAETDNSLDASEEEVESLEGGHEKIGTSEDLTEVSAEMNEEPSDASDSVEPIGGFADALGNEAATSDLAKDFEKRLADVEKKLKAASAPKTEEKKDAWIDISSEKWTVKLGGHVQMDMINWASATETIPAQNYFEFRRLRLLADGVGYGVYDFRLQMDIEPEGGDGVLTPVVDVKDAYFTMNEVPFFNRIRIGNFFVPTSLEQVTNDTNNIFMERSIPTQGVFAADREVGIAMYGVSDNQNFTWTFGTFLDSISESSKERIDDNQGQRLAGRLTWLPYYDEPSNGRYLIHLGVNVLSTNDNDDSVRFRARPQIHEGPFLIDSGALAASRYNTGGIELATVCGPFSMQSEMFVSSVNFTNGTSSNLHGMYVYGSYFLTGENRIYDRFGQHGAQFSRNVPYSNFFWIRGCSGPGAWELKSRWSYLDESQINKGIYNDFTAGLNWYWSDRTRIMFDWIHPFTTADTPFGTTSSNIIATRFDFNW